MLQVRSCSKTFKAGSLPLIHGKITTSPGNRATTGPRSGSFMGTRSRNGNCPDRVRFYGFMANVRYLSPSHISQTLMTSPFVAGAGKSILWYVHFMAISVCLSDLFCRFPVPRSSRTLMPCEDLGSRHWHFSTVTLEKIKRRTSAACSHLC